MDTPPFFKRYKVEVRIAICAVIIAVLTILYLQPQLVGDSPSYVEAMGVLTGLPVQQDFVPNRILTTFGGLVSVLALAPLLGILPAWLFINVMFYVGMALASLSLFKEVFDDERVAFLGPLFIVGSYAPLAFGLAYLMDIGGWMFLLLALWGVARFVRTGSTAPILWAAAAVGIGGLFKEYALLGCIAIAVALVWHAFRDPIRAISLMPLTAAIALAPVAFVHMGVYQHFGYTYLDWAHYNAEKYIYDSRIGEFIKALGSLTNVLAPLAVIGTWIWVRELVRAGRDAFSNPRHIIIIAVVASTLPVFFWGGITQRVLFVTIPAFALLAGFLFEQKKKWRYSFLGISGFYFLINVSMDHLLEVINLPF